MRMGLFGLHSASEQPEILLMFRNQVASELLMKNERIRQHWAFPAQRWGAGAGPGTSCPPSHGLCCWLGPARPLPPLCHSWSLRTSEFADLWGPGPSQRIPSCDPFLLSKVKAECAGGPDRSQRAGLPALPPLSPRIRSLPPCTERVLRPGRGSCTRPGVLSGPGRLRVQTSARPRQHRSGTAPSGNAHRHPRDASCPRPMDRRTHSVRSSHRGRRGDRALARSVAAALLCEGSGTVHGIIPARARSRHAPCCRTEVSLNRQGTRASLLTPSPGSWRRVLEPRPGPGRPLQGDLESLLSVGPASSRDVPSTPSSACFARSPLPPPRPSVC